MIGNRAQTFVVSMESCDIWLKSYPGKKKLVSLKLDVITKRRVLADDINIISSASIVIKYRYG